jgi:hypothetical protein
MDLWGHVLFGGDILRGGAIPRTDHYSFTSDISWVNHEWLAELAMFAAYRMAGPAGLSLLRLTLVIGALIIIVGHFRRYGLPPAATDLLLALVVVGTLGQLGKMRPQVFSFFLFALLLHVLVVRQGWTRAGLAFVMMVAWANLHGGWVVGAGTLLVWTLSEIARPEERWRIRGEQALLLLLAICGVVVNPYGLGMLSFIRDTVELGREGIIEWQPITSSSVGPVWVSWTAVCAFSMATAIRFWRRLTLDRLLIVLMFGAAAFRVVRLVGFFAISAAMLLGPLYATGRRPVPVSASAAMKAVAWVVSLAVAITLIAPRLQRLPCVAMEGPWMPDPEVVPFLKANGARGRLIAWFNHGQYAIWHLAPDLKVSMDGRRETVYSESVRRRHSDAYHLRPGGLDYALSLDADYAWLPSTLPLVPALRQAGWVIALSTESSVVLSSPDAPALAADLGHPGPATRRCFPGP